MTNWSAFSAADFDKRRAPRRAAQRAAADAAAGQGGLFFVATPELPAAPAPVLEQMDGQGDLFSAAGDEDAEPDWCCASAGEIAAYLARHAPGMTDAGIDQLPRPVQAQARAARDGHVPDPGPEQGAFDVCAKCGQPIRQRPETGQWVTMTSFNHECYGRRS